MPSTRSARMARSSRPRATVERLGSCIPFRDQASHKVPHLREQCRLRLLAKFLPSPLDRTAPAPNPASPPPAAAPSYPRSDSSHRHGSCSSDHAAAVTAATRFRHPLMGGADVLQAAVGLARVLFTVADDESDVIPAFARSRRSGVSAGRNCELASRDGGGGTGSGWGLRQAGGN
jgi:hypothetical protein